MAGVGAALLANAQWEGLRLASHESSGTMEDGWQLAVGHRNEENNRVPRHRHHPRSLRNQPGLRLDRRTRPKTARCGATDGLPPPAPGGVYEVVGKADSRFVVRSDGSACLLINCRAALRSASSPPDAAKTPSRGGVAVGMAHWIPCGMGRPRWAAK